MPQNPTSVPLNSQMHKTVHQGKNMPKWSSPLFSDIRNAIGQNVVFSTWKGRPYVRSWVHPANPRTSKQLGHRAVMTELVKRYQSLMADLDVKAAWNKEALPELISGFNLFTKQGRLSSVAVSPKTGTAPLTVTVTYTCGIPLAKAMLVRDTAGALTIVRDVGTLEAGVGKTVSVANLPAGTHLFFLANAAVLKAGETKPKSYQNITKWKPDVVNGVAEEAKVVAS